MFNPFKKNKKTDVGDDVVALWQDFLFENQSFSDWLTDWALNGTVLDLTVKIPSNVNAEKLYNALCQHIDSRLADKGAISEINLSVIAEKPSQNLPKTTNVMQNPPKNQQDTDNSDHDHEEKTPPQKTLPPHPRIRHIIAVASGKGGVGKSTTTVNLALALQALGHKVGVLDADIYGPSVPDMLGVAGVSPMVENEQFVPIDAHGLAMLSIGSLLDGSRTPVAWRGIKAVGALMQLYGQTNWPNLDFLLIDMPPGTGDIALSLAQKIPVTGAVIVTTPQHIALLDVVKGIELFNKTHIPVIGVVENMAVHICSNCGHHEPIFGAGGGDLMAKNYGVPLLGQLPLAISIRENADKGKPSVLSNDDYANYYTDIAKNIAANIDKYAKKKSDRIF